MSDNKYDCLKIENQLCFPLYAAAKEVVKKYTPFLEALDLTYTQYITMMVMWDVEEITVKELGKKLFLDSGTLTPLLKKLEAKGLVNRVRATEDERNLNVILTDQGRALKDKAVDIPAQLGSCMNLTQEEAANLYVTLYKILGKQGE